MNMESGQREKLIADLVRGEQGLVELAEKHTLNADELARWVSEPANRRALAGMCVLADLQTQLQLSRYRMMAASRLLTLATKEDGDDSKTSRDVARRACMDLLKLDLDRASGEGEATGDGGSEEFGGAVVDADLKKALRGLLYDGVDGEVVESASEERLGERDDDGS